VAFFWLFVWGLGKGERGMCQRSFMWVIYRYVVQEEPATGQEVLGGGDKSTWGGGSERGEGVFRISLLNGSCARAGPRAGSSNFLGGFVCKGRKDENAELIKET